MFHTSLTFLRKLTNKRKNSKERYKIEKPLVPRCSELTIAPVMAAVIKTIIMLSIEIRYLIINIKMFSLIVFQE